MNLHRIVCLNLQLSSSLWSSSSLFSSLATSFGSCSVLLLSCFQQKKKIKKPWRPPQHNGESLSLEKQSKTINRWVFVLVFKRGKMSKNKVHYITEVYKILYVILNKWNDILTRNQLNVHCEILSNCCDHLLSTKWQNVWQLKRDISQELVETKINMNEDSILDLILTRWLETRL